VIVLPDTSIWVGYLRHGAKSEPGAQLDSLLEQRSVVVCGPVLAELLAGTPEASRIELWSLLSVLPWARLEAEEWRLVGETAARLRAVGETVGLTDITIAVAAAGAGAALWTRDGDFRRVERVLPTLGLYDPSGT
jgi:predicted nucleic acid-binding protein